MYRTTILLMALSVFILSETHAESANSADKDNTPKITVTSLDISDKALNLVYEIRNDSQQDVWICDSISLRYNFEIYLNEDGQTLIIRKRMDVPSSAHWSDQPQGKYIRLHPGEKRVESLLLYVPVHRVCEYKYYESREQLHRVVNAKRLSIEIGYFVGDLPEMFYEMLKGSEKTDLDSTLIFNHWFGGILGFNSRNEKLRQRDEEVVIPYTKQRFKGEQVLQTIIDNLNIPYQETAKIPRYNPPDLNRCTRVKIQYEPSMLEYFYPYQSQQSLLTKKEMGYLSLEKSVVIKNSEQINNFADEIRQEKHFTGSIVSEKSKANILCYRGSKRLMSLIVYNNSTIETKQEQRFKYHNDLRSLKMYTPQIQPIELRMQCAANLKNLWYRLQFYDRAEKTHLQSYSNLKLDELDKHYDQSSNDMDTELEKINYQAQLFFETMKKHLADLYSKIMLIYPAPGKWCDALEWSFAGTRIRSKDYEVDLIMKVHVCPGAGEGKNHYAMNPNCKPDSPPDMVLLFETKAGWNQHGGPELFTFDNHDPKGGCVLLNDGTVKFIRTKEELRQLRWLYPGG